MNDDVKPQQLSKKQGERKQQQRSVQQSRQKQLGQQLTPCRERHNVDKERTQDLLLHNSPPDTPKQLNNEAITPAVNQDDASDVILLGATRSTFRSALLTLSDSSDEAGDELSLDDSGFWDGSDEDNHYGEEEPTSVKALREKICKLEEENEQLKTKLKKCAGE